MCLWGTPCSSLGSPDLTSLFLTIQFSNQPETPDSNQQLQQALEERAQLETHVGQVRLCRGGPWKEHDPR